MSLRVALDTLRANPLRTLLSTLGVVIGVASLVAVLALGDGLEAFSRSQIEDTTDLHVIQITPVTTDRVHDVVLRRERYVAFTTDDERALAQRLAPDADVGLSISYASFWRPADESAQRQLVVSAATPGFFDVARLELAAGRALTADEVARAARVAVVSHGVATRLAPSVREAVGRTLLVADTAYAVVGVAAADGRGREEPVGRVAIPFAPAERLPGLLDRRAPELTVRAHDVMRVSELRQRAEAWLTERYGGLDSFTVASNVQRVEQTERAMSVFKLVMGAITGISLVVGGIGIMNILLASISERTREIGIRRAAGARRADIRRQFLTESIAISALGAGIGLALGLAASLALMAATSRVTGAPVRAVFAWETMAFAVAAALFVGVAFGMYPALRASRLSPIEALRHE